MDACQMFQRRRETRLDHEELKGWGHRIFCIQNYKDDHMVWKATDEHDTSPHMPVSHHKWHVLACGNILYEHTHTFMCSFTLTHRKKWGGGGAPQRHPLQKAFMLITVRALCLTYSVAIMHNSTHRQQAGQYSRPWFRRHRLWLNIAVCEFETLN